jgi:UbiD family decarboxylase
MDPVTWSLAAVKVGAKGEYEPELAGGLFGHPLDVVKCETNDLLVPAQAEMIIEGEIPLDEFEEEGPFGEFLGFQGPRKPSNFIMHVNAITHRQSPWFFNAFSGITFDMPHALWASIDHIKYEKQIPSYIDTFRPGSGVIVVRIDKRSAGEGLEAGKIVLAHDSYAKVIIVVDKDVNSLDSEQILWAMGSMWQPHPATYIEERMVTSFTDPSSPEPGITSRVAIDATRQLPGEGGPQSYALTNRSLLKSEVPDILSEMSQKWSYLWKR